VAALAVALTLQLDAVTLVNRLSVDKSLRDSLVKLSINVGAQEPPPAAQPAQQPQGPIQPAPLLQPQPLVQPQPLTQPPPAQSSASSAAAPVPAPDNRRALDDLSRLAIISPIKLDKEWWQALPSRFPGILLSTALLSFGAPFWYSALKNLLKLRSALAGRDEAERTERSTTTPPPSAASTVPSREAPPAPLASLQRGEASAMEPVG
jgi:hypothetical protein